MSRRLLLIAVAAALAPAALAAPAAEGGTASACARQCAVDAAGGGAPRLACESAVADCLIEAGEARAAVDRLKALVRAHPQRPDLGRLLARAYLADGNPFWAQRTLQRLLARDSADCESRAWLAWIYVGEGDLDLAREQLADPACPRSAAERARWHLFHSYILRAEGDVAASAAEVEAAQAEGALLPEDQQLWRRLRDQADPMWLEPLSLRLQLDGGYTSNALAGSPTDPGAQGTSSPLVRLDNFGRFAWPLTHAVRPALEGSLKLHGIGVPEASRLSYALLKGRPGLYLGDTYPRLLLSYSAELLLLASREKRLFYEGHRLDLEVETAEGLLAFVGAGPRIFREGGRSRFEIDGGLGGSLALPARAQLLLAAALRHYEAVGDPYDLAGATGLAMARVPLWQGFFLRLGATLGVDWFYASGGDRGRMAYGTDEKRFDLLTKMSAGLWSPPWAGARAGLSYDFSWRRSTAGETDDYSYLEHRLLLSARWVIDLNPWAPRTVTPEGHLPLRYAGGARGGAALDEERVQDLLRQDEAARRGSSCVD